MKILLPQRYTGSDKQKWCPISLVIGTMQNKIAKGYVYIHIRYAKITDIKIKCWQECGKTGHFLHCLDGIKKNGTTILEKFDNVLKN